MSRAACSASSSAGPAGSAGRSSGGFWRCRPASRPWGAAPPGRAPRGSIGRGWGRVHGASDRPHEGADERVSRGVARRGPPKARPTASPQACLRAAIVASAPIAQPIAATRALVAGIGAEPPLCRQLCCPPRTSARGVSHPRHAAVLGRGRCSVIRCLDRLPAFSSGAATRRLPRSASRLALGHEAGIPSSSGCVGRTAQRRGRGACVAVARRPHGRKVASQGRQQHLHDGSRVLPLPRHHAPERHNSARGRAVGCRLVWGSEPAHRAVKPRAPHRVRRDWRGNRDSWRQRAPVRRTRIRIRIRVCIPCHRSSRRAAIGWGRARPAERLVAGPA
mmetsp:Transcript_15245/g.57580  ORF Transcript_15245/g.57580 Transcript_15245/m.57580 type:complete len:334 (+) Transcript_15245:1815-2816(+)